MIKKMVLIGGSLLLLNSAISMADGEETQSASMEQRRTEMQIRMQSMSAEERALYKELNGGGQGNGDGSGKQHRYGQGGGEGSGNKYRYGQGNSGGSEGGGEGYGSGYGSRAGGGGGRGRGH